MSLINQHDYLLFRALYQDKKVMRKITQTLSDKETKQAFDLTVKYNQANQNINKGPLVWRISHQQSDLGIQSLQPYENEPSFAEVGMMLLTQAQGKPWALEASIAILDYGFNHLGYQSIIASFDPTNFAIKRIARLLKFRPLPDTERERIGLTYSTPNDTLYYQLERSRFNSTLET